MFEFISNQLNQTIQIYQDILCFKIHALMLHNKRLNNHVILDAVTFDGFPFTCISEPTCEAQVDLCFLIDSSGSIRDNNPSDGSYDNWLLQQEFLALLVDLFTIGPDATRVGAVVFSEQVNLAFALNTYTDADSVKNAILGLAYLGQTTNTPEGFRITREQCFNTANGDRPNVQNLCIFISDGVPFPADRRDPAIREAESLRNAGVLIIPIGVTDVIDRDLLRAISSPPQVEGENYFIAADFTALGEIRRAVGEGTCDVIEGKGTLSFLCGFDVSLCL